MNTPTFANIKIMSGPDKEGIYAAVDTSTDGGRKCFHMKIGGTVEKPVAEPLYTNRFDDVGGFYYGFAVAQRNGSYFHIRTDGLCAYSKSYTESATSVAAFDEHGKALVCTRDRRFWLVASEAGGHIEKQDYERDLVPSS